VVCGLVASYPRIQSLRNPCFKMSKSSPHPSSVLFLTDSPSTIHTKLKSALTDSIPGGVSYDPENRPGISNLLQIHSGYSGDKVEEICKRFQGERGIREFKQELGEVVSEGLRGFRGEFERVSKEKGWVRMMERKGAEKASEVARETMKEVRRVVGTQE